MIVHKNKDGFPTGGHDAPRVFLEIVTEYIPTQQRFRIKVPEHMRERVGIEYVSGETASEAYQALAKVSQKFMDTFMVTSKLRKVIWYKFDVSGEDHQGILSTKIYINFRWRIEYYCHLVQDKEDDLWIPCDKDGKIGSSRAMQNRVDLTKPGYDEVCIDWTPDREEFFTGFIEEFNNLKMKMMDFFHPMNTEQMQALIDSGTRALPIIGGDPK